MGCRMPSGEYTFNVRHSGTLLILDFVNCRAGFRTIFVGNEIDLPGPWSVLHGPWGLRGAHDSRNAGDDRFQS